MADAYSLSALGWFLYVGVPVIVWLSTAIWYLRRKAGHQPAQDGGDLA